jgi:D-alanine-D-alanine ligase
MAVLFGGRSGEHAVSLASARSVLGAVDRDRYELTEIGITTDGHWLSGERTLDTFFSGSTGSLHGASILPDPGFDGLYQFESEGSRNFLKLLSELDVVFPVLHGTFGEDGTIQGLLELANIAYVGAGVTASAVGMDKGIFKDVMRAHGIPVVPSAVILRSVLERDPQGAVQTAESVGSYPLFTKPANLGSSVGVTKCRSRSDLLEGLMDAARFDRRILVEVGIDAREIEVSVLGNDDPTVSLAGEILPAGDFYTYAAKYHNKDSELIIPAPLSAALAEQVARMAVQAFKAIDGAGLARVDFLLDRRDGRLYLSELNTMPGFTEISMYPKLWEASGLPYPSLVDKLVELAFERQAEKNRTQFILERDSLP